MSVTAFQDLPLADRDREWDGDAAESRVRAWANAEDEPTEKYRDAHVWYDSEKKGNFTAYKLLIADVVDGRVTTWIGSRATWRSTTPRWTTPLHGTTDRSISPDRA
jgi:hypothetical protein